MEGKYLEPNHRYLMRLKNKQIPVIYNGWGLWNGHGGEEGLKRHAFTRLDNGEWVFKARAGALSRHYDDCAFAPLHKCTCHARLEMVGRKEVAV
jgi:hypothetical protein